MLLCCAAPPAVCWPKAPPPKRLPPVDADEPPNKDAPATPLVLKMLPPEEVPAPVPLVPPKRLPAVCPNMLPPVPGAAAPPPNRPDPPLLVPAPPPNRLPVDASPLNRDPLPDAAPAAAEAASATAAPNRPPPVPEEGALAGANRLVAGVVVDCDADGAGAVAGAKRPPAPGCVWAVVAAGAVVANRLAVDAGVRVTAGACPSLSRLKTLTRGLAASDAAEGAAPVDGAAAVPPKVNSDDVASAAPALGGGVAKMLTLDEGPSRDDSGRSFLAGRPLARTSSGAAVVVPLTDPNVAPANSAPPLVEGSAESDVMDERVE
mmetsp:Transcript_26677/g.76488  ORF Transcript_26677/g.76488 Transcript_26677/m.76488 type:complete len:319 (-) Transcript_26677:1357-2313(-)